MMLTTSLTTTITVTITDLYVYLKAVPLINRGTAYSSNFLKMRRLPYPNNLQTILIAGLMLFAMILGIFTSHLATLSIKHSHSDVCNEHIPHHDDHEDEHVPSGTHDDHQQSNDSHHHHLNSLAPSLFFIADESIHITVFSISNPLTYPLCPLAPDEPFFERIKPPIIG